MITDLLQDMKIPALVIGGIIFFGIVIRMAIHPVAKVAQEQSKVKEEQSKFKEEQLKKDEHYNKVIEQMKKNNEVFERFITNTQVVFENVNQNLHRAVGGLELTNLNLSIVEKKTNANSTDIATIKEEVIGLAKHVKFRTALKNEISNRSDSNGTEAV